MKRKLAAAVVAALAMVAIGACGSSADNEPAAKTTAPASSTAPTTTPEAPAGGAVDGGAIATKMVDAMIASKTAHTTLTGDGTQTAEGDYEFSSPVKVTMKISQPGSNMEIVQVDGVTYIKGVPGTTKPWIKLDPKGTDPFSKVMTSVTDMSQSSDPRALVTLMAGIKGKDLGTEQVGGLSTRHYAFEVPLSAYGKMLSPPLLKLMQGMIKGPIAFDYWVDDADLPLKVTSSMVLSGKKSTTEITYSNWGKPVNIVAPPAAQVGQIPGT